MKSLISPSLKSLAIGATAAATLAGFGLASAPAQAAWLMLTPNPDHLPPGGEIPGGTTNAEYWVNEQIGYDNAIIKLVGNPGEVVQLQLDYLGNGTAQLQNYFQWDMGSGYQDLFGPGVAGNSDWQPCSHKVGGAGCWNGNPSNSGNFVARAMKTITLDSMGMALLPFQYNADRGGVNALIPNGDPGNSLTSPHYMAVIGDDGTTAYPFNPTKTCLADGSDCKSDLVGLGLSDRGIEGTDNDASDSNVKITIKKTPEPSAALGLLAIAGLGLVAAKRQKQS